MRTTICDPYIPIENTTLCKKPLCGQLPLSIPECATLAQSLVEVLAVSIRANGSCSDDAGPGSRGCVIPIKRKDTGLGLWWRREKRLHGYRTSGFDVPGLSAPFRQSPGAMMLLLRLLKLQLRIRLLKLWLWLLVVRIRWLLFRLMLRIKWWRRLVVLFL